MTLESEIQLVKKVFKPTVLSTEAAETRKFFGISKTYDVTIDDLVAKWQAMLFKLYGGDQTIKLDDDKLMDLKRRVIEDWQRKSTNDASAISQAISAQAANKFSPKFEGRKKNFGFDLINGSSPRKRVLNGDKQDVKMFTKDSISALKSIIKSQSPIKSQNPTNTSYSPARNIALPSKVSATDSIELYNKRKANNYVEFTLGQKPQYAEKAPRQQLTVSTVPSTWPGTRNSSGHSSARTEYRYMVESLADKLEYLDSNTEKFSDMSKSHYQIQSLANPRYMHQDDVYVVGRIVDGNSGMTSTENAAGGAKPTRKFNSASVELATTKRLGTGRSIQLDLKSTKHYSLFPGQVVLAKGKNLVGSEFSVSEFLKLPSLPNFDAENSKYGGKAESFEMFVASGPYTTMGNFEYLPLEDLAREIIEKQPSVVVLMGPFVSEAQVKAMIATLDFTPEEIFANKISPIFEEILRNCGDRTKLIIQPSVDDACFPYVVYPQPVLSAATRNELRIPASVKAVPNPAQLLINGRVCCFSSADSLLSLSANEINSGNHENKRLERLANHMIEQQSFYPTDPFNNLPLSYSILVNESTRARKASDLPTQNLGHDNNQDKDLALELEKSNNLDSVVNVSPINLAYMPNIMVVVSQLKALACNLQPPQNTQDLTNQNKENLLNAGNVFVNPGKLSIGYIGGSYAKIYVPAPASFNKSSSTQGLETQGKMSQDICVEIIKL